MKLKTMFLAGAATAMSTLALGQARETTLTVGKDKIDAVKIEVNAPSKDVEKALQQQLATSGVKPKKGSASSYSYNDVTVSNISSDTVDVWTRVQKNGDKSVIYMAVKDQQGNYLSGSSDTATVEKVKDFLYDFARAQNYSSNDVEIGALMDSVEVDQSSFEKYNSDKARIESQIKDLQTQLQALDSGFSTSRSEMDRRKQRLDELKTTSGSSDVNTGNGKDTKKSSSKGSGTNDQKSSSAKNGGTTKQDQK